MIHYFLDPNKNYRDFKRRSVYHRCVKHCADAEIVNIDTRIPIDVNHPWFGPPDACRNSERDCANNQICNFFPEGFLGLPDHHGNYDNYDESLNWGLKMVQEHWNPAAWKVSWFSIGESGCIDCPGTTAESCRDDGAYLNRRTFEDCIEICAGGNNPNNVQMNEPYLGYVFA